MRALRPRGALRDPVISSRRAVVQGYAAVCPLALPCMIVMIKIMHLFLAPLVE